MADLLGKTALAGKTDLAGKTALVTGSVPRHWAR
jgi:hypothetical protein